MRYLLDSVIVIDHLNHIEPASAFIKEHATQSVLSVITRAEVLTGVAAKDEPLVRNLLDCFGHLEISTAIATLAAQLRRQHGWKLPDAFQAAIAVHHGLTLVTRNSRDFPPEKFEFVRIPYRL